MNWRIRVLLLVSYGALVALHLYLSRHVTVPVLYADGMGYLANARVLSGVGTVPQLDSPFYHFGYSLFLVPAYWLSATPEGVHRAALVVNAVLSSLHLPVLYWLGRSLLELKAREALLAGLVASLYPPFLLQSSLVWTESIFPVLFSSWIALAVVAERRGALGGALAFVWMAVFTYATHPRGIVLLPLAVVFLAWLRHRGRITTGVLIAAVGALVLAFLATEVVNRELHRVIWSWKSQEEPTRSMRLLGGLRTIELGGKLAAAVTGQTWYLLCASVGLMIPGIAALAATLWRGPWRGHEKAFRGPSASAALAILGSLGVLAVSSLSLARGGTRVDYLVYGRYNEAFLGVLLLAGISAVLQSRRARNTALHLSLAAVAIALSTGVLLVAASGALARTLDMPLTVLGVLVFEREYQPFGPSRGVFRPDAIAVAALSLLAVFGVVALRLRRTATVLLGCFFVFAAIDVEARVVRPVASWASDLLHLHHWVREMGVGRDIAYDRSRIDAVGLNGYQFYLPNHQFEFFDGGVEEPPADLVFAPRQWERASAWGARRIASEPTIDQALWVVPAATPDRGAPDEPADR